MLLISLGVGNLLFLADTNTGDFFVISLYAVVEAALEIPIPLLFASSIIIFSSLESVAALFTRSSMAFLVNWKFVGSPSFLFQLDSRFYFVILYYRYLMDSPAYGSSLTLAFLS